VTDQSNNPEAVNSFIEFADRVLGKNVIHAKDTPGFIGNRIGMFWILCAMEEAKREGVSIPMADSIMNGAFGFPKTGIFALADLIGLKIIPDIAGSMCKFLHKSDAFQPLNEAILPLIEARIKAQGGFYKKTEKGGKQALDLKTGKYEDVKKEKPVVGDDWQKFLGQDTPESRFAKATLTRLLGYTAAIAPDIADSVLEVDGAMRDGFGWKFGPFQIIDKLTPTWLLKQRGVGNVLPLLEKAKEHGFYTNTTYLDFSGQYKQRTPDKDKWTLALKTNGKKPVLENDKAKLWDIGDGITCFEITTKMHVINQDVLDLLHQAIEKTEQDFAGLVVGHDDKNFSGGLDLNIALKCATDNNWEPLESVIKQGQDCMMRLKYARIPSVVALCGYAVGGACEMTIHSTAAQCHIATRLGLVETSIGVVPAWGGTTEHLVIALRRGGDDADAVVKHAILAFQEIAAARKTKNAEEAFTMELIKEPSGITMNRERLLPDAKALCLKLSDKYEPKKEMAFKVPVDKLYVELTTEAERIFLSDPKETLHQRKVLQQLAELLSGYAVHRETGNKDEWQTLTERDILKATCKAFMTLAQEKESQEEIRKVLGK
jgi:3-hydroxyacyl-CoA dehydrogenase